MKILHVITEGNVVGGAGVVVLTLCRRLIQDGHDVIIATGPPGHFSAMLVEAGLPWREIRSMKREIDPLCDIRAVGDIRRLIRGEWPDLVVCHSSKAGVVGRIAARLESIPSVFTVHGWAFTEGVPQPQRTVYGVIERLMAHVTTRIVCVSEYDRQLAISLGLPNAKIMTVHNGVPDTAVAEAEDSNENGLDVAMVARFDEPKDQPTLVRAIADVAGVTVHFIGDGPTKASVESLAKELGVSDRCVFYGYRDDVDAVLRRCDAFCLTSLYEGFPLTTLEAMKLGLAAIVTDVGGAREAVEVGRTGFVVSRGDVHAVAQSLSVLRDDPELRQRMGRASRRRFIDLYTVERMYESTLAVYRSAAAEAPPQRKPRIATRLTRHPDSSRILVG